MNASLKKYLQLAMLVMFCFALPEVAMAAGADTGESSATGIQTWLNTWIPIACAVAIVVCAFAWMLHLIPISWVPRIVFGLIFIGSATYLVSLTGVGS